MSKPRIILWDIETTQNLVAVFQLKNNDWINPDNIIRERYIVSACWKVLGESKVHSVSVLDDPKLYAKDPHNDLHVVKTLHKVLSEADVIIAHNGDAYDIKFTEARMLIQGLSPLPPLTKIDTLKAARDRFMFNANNLNYLGKVLGCGEKVHTEPGLWLRVLNGDKNAIKAMVAYNKQDVVLLEKVFLKLQPYIANHINRQLYGEVGCPRCASHKVQSRGVHRAISNVYQRYQCQDCGGWFRELKADKAKSAKTRVL
jgi:hypothetical protein